MMDAPSTPPVLAASQPPKLLDSLRQRIRVLHYSIRTEQAYVDWARRFILFHGKRHPREMGAPEVTAFLTHLAVARNVSASTQNQAKAAILFLYKEVLQQDLPWLDEVVSAKKARRLPVVLTQREVRELLLHLQGTQWLVASLLYGTGMRILEALRLRVKDVEFERRELVVREGKGNKVTLRPFETWSPFGSMALPLNLASTGNSPDRSTKSTRSHLNVLPQLVNTGFQVLFHSPPGVLFTFPSQYYALSVTK